MIQSGFELIHRLLYNNVTSPPPTDQEACQYVMTPRATSLIFCACLLAAGNVQATTIGLQFLVDRASIATLPEHEVVERIESMTHELNGYYRESRVNLNATVNRVQFIDITSNDAVDILDAMHLSRGDFKSLASSADEFGADYAIAFKRGLTLRGKEICGRGYDVNQTVEEISSTDRAVAVMQIQCGAHTLAHELGHLMGLNHGTLVDSCDPHRGHKNAIAPHANGYGIGNCDGMPDPGEFGTIMVGGWMKVVDGRKKNRYAIFSNPDLQHDLCGQDRRCGEPDMGNAARALNDHAHIYAAHEEPDVHTLDFPDPALSLCLARQYLGREISALQQLDCAGLGIQSLDGIEQLSHLESINVSDNRISTVEPLLRLSSALLKNVELTGNPAVPCGDIDKLRSHFPGARLNGPGRCP